MNIRDIMEKEVITASLDMRVKDVAKLLYDHNISAIPVLDEKGEVVGIVSEEDLIYRLSRPHIPAHIEILGGIIYLGNPFEMKKELDKLQSVTAGEIMTKKVFVASPDSQIADVATAMVEKDINGVPVIEEGKIIGIITRHDLLTAIARKEGQKQKNIKVIKKKTDVKKVQDRKESIEISEMIASEEYHVKNESSKNLLEEIPISYGPSYVKENSSNASIPEMSPEYAETNIEKEK